MIRCPRYSSSLTAGKGCGQRSRHPTSPLYVRFSLILNSGVVEMKECRSFYLNFYLQAANRSKSSFNTPKHLKKAKTNRSPKLQSGDGHVVRHTITRGASPYYDKLLQSYRIRVQAFRILCQRHESKQPTSFSTGEKLH